MTTATFFGVTVGSTEPIYRQLVAQVWRLIAGGHLKSDDKMPSVRDLAQFLAINPTTVSKAFGMLEAEALLTRQRDRAMVVADRHRDGPPIADRLGLLRPTLERAAQESRELRLTRSLAVRVFEAILGDR
ncbi:MAG: GntR family transcriptional regulator [Pseudolysinimonas sp.]